MAKILNEKPVYSVSEITGILDNEISSAFADIFVEGEVGDLSKSKAGHIYFKLKDENASLKVVIFKNNAYKINFCIENGMLLIVRGQLGFYKQSGDLELYASYAEPSGIGAMLMRIEQAKKNLQRDGLTDPQRKRKIPPYPKLVGVVTSLEGAAIRDFVSILKRRGANIELLIAPSSVQGKEAPAELKKSLKLLYQRKEIDVIVITRGGGSMEDLMAFNDESLARVVAESPVPVISAVGHEIDTVLTDLTADLRAPTPSVAAEILSQNYFAIKKELKDMRRKITESVQNILYHKQTRTSVFEEIKMEKLLMRKIERFEERRDKSFSFCSESIKNKTTNLKRRIESLTTTISPRTIYSNYVKTDEKIKALFESIHSKTKSKIELMEMAFKNKAQLIMERNPLNILSRGYAIVKNKEEKAVKEAEEVNLNDVLKVILFKGELKVKVEDKKN